MVILSDEEAEEFGINEGLGAFFGKLRGDYTALANEAKKKEEKQKAKAAKAEEKAKKQQELINRGQKQQTATNEWLDRGRWDTKENYLSQFKKIEKEIVKILLDTNGSEIEAIKKFKNELCDVARRYRHALSYKDARHNYENNLKNIGKGQVDETSTKNEEVNFGMFDY